MSVESTVGAANAPVITYMRLRVGQRESGASFGAVWIQTRDADPTTSIMTRSATLMAELVPLGANPAVAGRSVRRPIESG
jgi:hypothetical protein